MLIFDKGEEFRVRLMIDSVVVLSNTKDDLCHKSVMISDDHHNNL